MRVWAALSQKGGSGKSTIMLHLAIAATAADRIASVIDLDPQKSAEKWGALRGRKTKTDDPIIVHGLPSQLDSMLDKARETGHELVLIDTPPAIDRTTILVAAKADLIIVPTRTSILDLQALDDTLTILKATQGGEPHRRRHQRGGPRRQGTGMPSRSWCARSTASRCSARRSRSIWSSAPRSAAARA